MALTSCTAVFCRRADGTLSVVEAVLELILYGAEGARGAGGATLVLLLGLLEVCACGDFFLTVFGDVSSLRFGVYSLAPHVARNLAVLRGARKLGFLVYSNYWQAIGRGICGQHPGALVALAQIHKRAFRLAPQAA